MPVILVLGRESQGDCCKFEDMIYTVRGGSEGIKTKDIGEKTKKLAIV